VLTPPTVELGNDTSLCGSSSILLDAGNPGSSYLWNDNTIQQTKLVSTTGTYSVTVAGSNSCTASSDIVVSSTALVPPVISTAHVQLCSGDTAVVCPIGAGFAQYLWNTGSTSNCVNATLAGNYYVTVTDANGCTAESNHLAISVYPSPSVSISVNGDSLSAFNAVDYQWYLNGGLIPGATSNVYVATQSGIYTVQVTDANGCHAISSAISVVTGILNPNEDHIISVYPNPSISGQWHLSVTSELIGKPFEILDNIGRILYHSKIKAEQSEISIDIQAPSGVYWLRVISETGNYSQKLVRL
jgi:hypothetical protein